MPNPSKLDPIPPILSRVIIQYNPSMWHTLTHQVWGFLSQKHPILPGELWAALTLQRNGFLRKDDYDQYRKREMSVWWPKKNAFDNEWREGKRSEVNWVWVWVELSCWLRYNKGERACVLGQSNSGTERVNSPQSALLLLSCPLEPKKKKEKKMGVFNC